MLVRMRMRRGWRVAACAISRPHVPGCRTTGAPSLSHRARRTPLTAHAAHSARAFRTQLLPLPARRDAAGQRVAVRGVRRVGAQGQGERAKTVGSASICVPGGIRTRLAFFFSAGERKWTVNFPMHISALD